MTIVDLGRTPTHAVHRRLIPPVSDAAPTCSALTGYDEQHLVTYLRLLDADAEGADWQEVARIVLHLDPVREPDRARKAWESHLTRARWMHRERLSPPVTRGRAALAGPRFHAATATCVAAPWRIVPLPSWISSR